jgi:cysteinyl-tRNA synthetase
MSSLVSKNNHLPWKQPSAIKPTKTALQIYNSLTDSKEDFHPIKPNCVSMYVCGPTVYDHAHMGHARAYLSFDIIRRILADYFQFTVNYQMNITDIDDKIILKGRKNHLWEKWAAENSSDPAVVFARGSDLAQTKKAKLESEKSQLLSTPTTDARAKAEIETKSKELDLKIEQISDLLTKAESSKNSIEELLLIFQEIIADDLDKQFGQNVTREEILGIFLNHARKYEESFFEDMKSLGVKLPDVVTRVTEFVPEIVDFIEKIIENGYAYESNGSVYFDTQKFKQSHDYPKLVPQNQQTTAAELAEGEGALTNTFAGEKKHKNDFALWKASKPGEPSWESKSWGLGRPGWHIECSVMAGSVFGKKMDIHGGGSDLKFPHHANECAQSEAFYYAKKEEAKEDGDAEHPQWVNYFMHAGHLHIKGLKMSKSLKNFITIKQALANFSARQLRLMFLLQNWEKPVNFSDNSIQEAKDKETRFNSFFTRIQHFQQQSTTETFKWDETDFKLNDLLVACETKVHESLLDNFNTPLAMSALEEIVSSVNTYLLSSSPKFHLLNKAANYVHKILRVFGVIQGESLGFGNDAESSSDGRLAPVLDAFCATRDTVRAVASTSKSKELFQLSDELRDKTFVDLGVRVEDDGKASRWSLEDPEVLRREIADKKNSSKASKQKK